MMILKMGVMVVAPAKMSYSMMLPSLPWKTRTMMHFFNVKPVHCAPLFRQLQQKEVQEQVDSGIMCESCNGKGWLPCDFCKGQKTNVKAENKRIYRRCPSCRAIGYVLCSKCKVLKCVTFPNHGDGEDLSF